MFGFKHGRLGSAGTRTLIQRAIASLRARGSDAHLWLPGGDVKTYGPELAASIGGGGWATSAGVSIVGETVVCSAASGAIFYRGADVSLGKTYRVVITISSYTSGSVRGNCFGNTSPPSENSSVGTFTSNQTITAANFNIGLFSAVAFTGTISSISVREITSITPTITSGLTTGNYLESTGNTLATVDNPVGLVLDALGTKITKTVPLFDGYNSTLTSQTLPATATSTTNGNFGFMWSDGYHELGRVYEYTITWSGNTANRGLSVDGANGALFSSAQSGTKTFICRQANARLYIYAVSALSGDAFTVTSFSVREVSGIHLTQSTTANKAVLRRGLTNLLTYSSDFSNAAWGKTNTSVTANSATAPDGTMTASVLTYSTQFGHLLSSYSPASGLPFTAAFWARTQSGTRTLATYDNLGNPLGSTVVTTTWTLHVVNFTLASSTAIVFLQDMAASGFQPIELWRNAIFQGTLTAAQILAAGGIPVTTTAAASNPDSGKYSWSFDGSNDSLALGSVPFQMGDDHCVIVGARCDSASGDRTVFGIRSTASNNPVIASLDFSSGVPRAVWRDDAGSGASLLTSDVAIATNCVLSNRKAGNNKLLRVNGVTKATDATVIGTTTPTSAAIGVQPLASPASYMQGQTGPVLAIKGTVTDAELLMYERLVAALTPGAPTF